jgi:hypothetical protein
MDESDRLNRVARIMAWLQANSGAISAVALLIVALTGLLTLLVRLLSGGGLA